MITLSVTEGSSKREGNLMDFLLLTSQREESYEEIGSKNTVSDCTISCFFCEKDFIIGENNHRRPRIYAQPVSLSVHR